MKYVLVIPGWFPSRVNFLAGDFIERHAAAASSFYPVVVLFVVKDVNLPAGKSELESLQMSENYHQYVFYYNSQFPVRLMEKLRSAWMQSRCLYKGFRLITQKYGLPSLIHAHVLLKHSWFAWRTAKKYNIPLIASEQWTGYLPEATGEFETLTSFQRTMIGRVLKQAVHVTTVSDYLARQLSQRFEFDGYTVIPNLVKMDLFVPSENPDRQKTFIHISTLSRQKNVEEIIEACKLLNDRGVEFRLLVVGPERQDLHSGVSGSGLQDKVIFQEELPQRELSRLVADSTALILYSNFETFGCVIAEANACGLPVIVSDFPVFRENVVEGLTGIRVPLHDPSALANAMQRIIENPGLFNKAEIINNTRLKYSAEVVGKQFADVYTRFARR